MKTEPLLDSRSLEIFLAVCNARSMTGAARYLGITQGAVSQQISRLEDTLQLKLMERNKRSELRLLPAGLHLQHHARRVVAELRDAQRAMQQFGGFSFPHVSVQVMDTLGKSLTSTVVETLQGVAEQIQVGASVTYRHREDLGSGEIDIVISAQYFDPGVFEIHPIAVEPILLLVPKNTLDSSVPVELDHLVSLLPFVRYAHQRHLGNLTDTYLARHMIEVGRSIEVDQAATVINTVRRGRGWAIGTAFSLLDPTFEAREIDVLTLPRPVPTRSINLVTKPGRFFDLPQKLAAECRQHLRLEVERLSSFVPGTSLPVIAEDTAARQNPD